MYENVNWPEHDDWNEELPKKYNAILASLVPREKMLLIPLHIKISSVTKLFKKI